MGARGASILLPIVAILSTTACRRQPTKPSAEALLQQLDARLNALPRPTNAMVDPIEARLAKVPCIGDVGRWQRLFSFASRPRSPRVDTGRIDFEFREAGRYDFRAGRRITWPDSWINLDDRSYRYATGWFDRTTGRLRVEYCGPNIDEDSRVGDISQPVDVH
jgi:hypothetical protein